MGWDLEVALGPGIPLLGLSIASYFFDITTFPPSQALLHIMFLQFNQALGKFSRSYPRPGKWKLNFLGREPPPLTPDAKGHEIIRGIWNRETGELSRQLTGCIAIVRR